MGMRHFLRKCVNYRYLLLMLLPCMLFVIVFNYAAMDSIFNEYRFAFCFGLYGDETEAKVEELRTIMHASGIDKVLEEYKAQVHAFLAE